MSELKIYCQACGEAQPFTIEPMRRDDLNSVPWGDILCAKCRFVISTLTSDKEGEVSISMNTRAASEAVESDNPFEAIGLKREEMTDELAEGIKAFVEGMRNDLSRKRATPAEKVEEKGSE